MKDLNKLSRSALSAAMRGGTAAWGQHGSSTEHIRYAEPIKSRKKCTCGCDGRRTHAGMANGVCLTSGCDLSIRRWIKTGSKTATSRAIIRAAAEIGRNKEQGDGGGT